MGAVLFRSHFVEVWDVCVLGLAHGGVGRVVVVWFVMAVGCLGQSVCSFCGRLLHGLMSVSLVCVWVFSVV